METVSNIVIQTDSTKNGEAQNSEQYCHSNRFCQKMEKQEASRMSLRKQFEGLCMPELPDLCLPLSLYEKAEGNARMSNIVFEFQKIGEKSLES